MTGQENKKIKVYVGVSGGVDSSVALALLQEQGYDVTGVFLKVWDPAKEFNSLPCTWRDERRSAMRVCATLGVPFITLDCEKEYKELVVDYMLAEYKAGRTPNPDVFCNKYVKFGTFLAKAMEAGADYVATGHYAQVEKRNTKNEKRQEEFESASSVFRISYFVLRESTDKEKDQSYFLHQLNQEQLAHTLFPIGHLQKSQVRELARKFGLPTAEKKDSQGLCFIGKVDMKDFLAHYIDAKPGDVLNEKGEIIGRHNGAVFYTIGERHGFRITSQNNAEQTQNAAERDGQAPRMFVVAKDISKNTIKVRMRNETRDTRYDGKNVDLNISHISYLLSPNSINWISGEAPNISQTYDVRFRYRQEKQRCKIVINDLHVQNVLNDKSPASITITTSTTDPIAPGQSAVIYDCDVCLGGGVIQ